MVWEDSHNFFRRWSPRAGFLGSHRAQPSAAAGYPEHFARHFFDAPGQRAELERPITTDQRLTFSPSASSTRRTSRFLPSLGDTAIRRYAAAAFELLLDRAVATPSTVTPSRGLSSRPAQRARTRARDNWPAVRQQFEPRQLAVIGQQQEASAVRSSRPTEITRGMPLGRCSNTVGRPAGSRWGVTSPAGLW